MEKMTTVDDLTQEGMIVDGKIKVFGLSRILETTIYNLHRLDIFWDILFAHFLCITHSNNISLRAQGVENFNVVVEKYMEYKKQEKPKPEDEDSSDSKWNSKSWQKTILQPWLDICRSKFTDVKENVCVSLLKLLQAHSYKINSCGWNIISEVLGEISQDGGKATLLGKTCNC
jgi:hypothetical protein